VREWDVAELDALLGGREQYRDLVSFITAANGLTGS
jgi:hypothetical protein